MKIGDHVKVKDNHVTRQQNICGCYGHISEVHVDTQCVEVQFNNFSKTINVCDLELVNRS